MTDNVNLVDSEYLIAKIQRMRFCYNTDKELAFNLGVSPQYLNDVLMRRRSIGEKLANALGYYPIRMYAELGSTK